MPKKYVLYKKCSSGSGGGGSSSSGGSSSGGGASSSGGSSSSSRSIELEVIAAEGGLSFLLGSPCSYSPYAPLFVAARICVQFLKG